jgi:hypothetical protein
MLNKVFNLFQNTEYLFFFSSNLSNDKRKIQGANKHSYNEVVSYTKEKRRIVVFFSRIGINKKTYFFLS